jgi:anti-sigma28 factor (negative regulator of flagellin synthesis)
VKAIKENIEEGTYEIDFEDTAGKIMNSFFDDMT